jgi:RNA polymerase sigma factor (sigma-70 family)
MNVHFTYKLSKTADLENLITQRIEKLQKRLQVFRPDLVSLYGSVDEHPKMGFNVALNLRLPSGQIAAREVADTASSAIKNCFESLKEQLAKHMDHLRAAYKWPRRRRPAGRAESQVPFEETLAAVQADVVSAQDINGWLNANLEKLERFVERELRYRGNSGQMRVEQITAEEVIGEAIANALDGRTEKPEKVTLEPWLYFLSRAAIDHLAEQARSGEGEVGLDSSVRREEVSDSDEAMLQFHHPDEMLTNENVIADGGTATPEEIAASDEVMGMIEAALGNAHHQDREAFILFTMEGFTVQEIAVITGRKPEEVRTSIAKAREHLRKALPVAEQLRNKLIEHSKSA